MVHSCDLSVSVCVCVCVCLCVCVSVCSNVIAVEILKWIPGGELFHFTERNEKHLLESKGHYRVIIHDPSGDHPFTLQVRVWVCVWGCVGVGGCVSTRENETNRNGVSERERARDTKKVHGIESLVLVIYQERLLND